MKFCSQLLALALVQANIFGGNAFMVQGPKAQSKVIVQSTYDNLETRLAEELSGVAGGLATRDSQIADMQFAKNIEDLEITRIQGGGALRTWSF
jgi:hypothetical protein